MKRYTRFAFYSLLALTAFFACCFFSSPHLRQFYNDQMEIAMRKEIGRPVVLPSPTSYPRLEESEAHARITELLETNGNCRFPCWWGIVPGETRWQEVHALLSPFMEYDAYLSRSDHGKIFFRGDYSRKLGVSMQTDDEFVHDILILDIPGENLSNLSITRMFQLYGMPDGIHIQAFPFPSDGLVRIFLYYPSQQWTAGYYYYRDEFGETMRVCGLDQPSHADFYVWDSASVQDFQTVATKALWHPEIFKTLHLNAATHWTTQSFYTTIREAGADTVCIETPASLWVENDNQ